MFRASCFSLNTSHVKKRIQELSKLIKKYQKEYYIESRPSISDAEFDKIFLELQNMEEAHPEYLSKTSPTQKVAVKSSKENIPHVTKMLSLANAFSKDDLIRFEKSVLKATSWKKDFYICETKFDGIAVDVVYQDGKLKHVLTRGDGIMGQNITENVLKYIPNFTRSVPKDMNLRGEIVMTRSEFAKVSAEYSNSRNVVSGLLLALKQRDDVKLDFISYQLCKSPFSTHFQSLGYLQQLNFSIDDQCQKVDTLDQIMEYIKEIESKRSQLPFEIDGVVIKLNHFEDQVALGENNRAPRWAIAYKFQGEKLTTKLLEIQYQVGRSGKITPVGILEPIEIQGATISRATLYNFDYIQKNGIKAGDLVSIERSGDVIPKITPLNEPKPIKFDFPKTCPCGKKTILEVKDTSVFCVEKACPEILTHQVSYFCESIGVKGVSKKTWESLILDGHLQELADVFLLKEKRAILEQRKGFGPKKVGNMIGEIEKCQDQLNFAKILTGVGIPRVGERVALLLAEKINSFQELKEFAKKKDDSIPGIGNVVYQEILNFCQSQNIEKLDKMLQVKL